jgi:hypothetical protein
MANGDDKAQLSSLMDSTAPRSELENADLELDIEVATPGTFVGKVNEVLPEGIQRKMVASLSILILWPWLVLMTAISIATWQRSWTIESLAAYLQSF